MKNTLIAAALLGASMTSAPLLAQNAVDAGASTLVVGATVYGTDGAEAGTIESVSGDNVVIYTGKNRATVPASAFGENEKGLGISMTREQLDAAVEAAIASAQAEASAAMDAALVADAAVKSKDGVIVGSVQKVEGDNVIVDLPGGNAVTLQKSHLTADAGGLKLIMTEVEFQAAVGAATAPSEG